jgi:regulator of protease activity HflC (stomatin/prohibitin superfamily)
VLLTNHLIHSFMGCYVVIEESNVGVIENLGQFSRLLNPGCHTLNCITETVKSKVSLSMKTLNLKVETLTQNQLSVVISVGIQYKVNDDNIQPPITTFSASSNDLKSKDDKSYEMNPFYTEKSKLLSHSTATTTTTSYQNAHIIQPSYLQQHQSAVYCATYLTNNHTSQITQFVNSYFRSISRKYSMEALFESQNILSDGLCEYLNQEMFKYGYYIHRVLITDIDPPDNVKNTMNLVKESENKRDAMINNAKAEKEAAILKAQGLAETRRLEGLGLANQRMEIVDGLKRSMINICGKDEAEIDIDKASEMILRIQELEMLHTAASNGKNTFIIQIGDKKPGLSSIEDQMRNALLSTKSTL